MLKEKFVTQGATVGKYRIESRVAEGGMGVFWRAVDTQLDRTVGLKTLHTEFVLEPHLRERFTNEARALAKLNHPNICVLFDFFESGQQLYIVMEYIVGETLADLVRNKVALSRTQIVPIFRQILMALDYAHNHGVIHRDIKPSNIMVTEQGTVKVMDFGIAKMVGSQMHLTRTGRKMGSVLFMSPEQIREQPVDHRSDIYSLGATLYQVCTGHVPFDATSEYEAMKSHLEDSPPSPRSINPSVAEDLEYVITRAMAKRPEERFQSAEEMRRALAAADAAISGDRVMVASAEQTRVDIGSGPANTRPAKRNLKKAWLISGLVLVSLLALGVARRLLRNGSETDSRTTSSAVSATPMETAVRRDSMAQALVPVDASLDGIMGKPTTSVSGATERAPAGPAEDVPATPNVMVPQSAPATAFVEPDVTRTPPAQTQGVKTEKTPAVASTEAKRPQIADQPAKPVVLNKYNVSVVVKPEGRFQIDRLGWGPPSGKIEEGVHRLEAIGPGFPIVVERFKLRRDTTITVDLAVRSAGLVEGDLRVSAKSETGEFPPCQVKINGREAGLLPGLRLPLKTGAYEIELVPPGNLQVDSLQFEGDSFEGSRARIKVPPASRSFARFFLSARK